MRSPRTPRQREWLIRIAWREAMDEHSVPVRTLRALLLGGWVILTWGHLVRVTNMGHGWVAAWRDGEKTIGGAG